MVCLTHWGRVTHICVCNLTIIGSDNGLSPGRRQAITWTNVGILLIGPLGTNFSEMLIEIHTFSYKKIHLKMSSGKWRPFCLGLNVCLYSHKKASATQYTYATFRKSRRNVTYPWWWPKCVKVWYSRYVWKAHCWQCTQITLSQYSFVTQFLPGLFGNPTGLSVHEPSVTMSSHTVSLLMKIRNEANLSF